MTPVDISMVKQGIVNEKSNKLCKLKKNLRFIAKWLTKKIHYYYNKEILLGIISKLYNIQGTRIIKAITTGNSTVQQNDINWSNRILGNEALAHIKRKIITQVFKPNIKPCKIPSSNGSKGKISCSVCKRYR